MSVRFADIPAEIRRDTAAALQARGQAATERIAAILAGTPGMDPAGWSRCADALVSAFAFTLESGELDSGGEAIYSLSRFNPPLTVGQMIRSVETAERVLLELLADDGRIGGGSRPWPMVVRAVHGAAFEIACAYAHHEYGRPAIRDPLTMLISPRVLRLALQQEIARAKRHKHGVSVLLFDVDDLPVLEASLGPGSGDRLLERLGILARQFFRSHDWVARHGGQSIAVLLPETTADQAAALATGFRDMVGQRVVLRDDRDVERRVTLSAAAIGADRVREDMDAGQLLAELEAAARRARDDGGDRTATVTLPPA